MPRSNPGFYDTIEYIGPRPQKKKRPNNNVFGGWVIVLIAVGLGFWFGQPIYSAMVTERVTATPEEAQHLIATLNRASTPSARIAAAALAQSKERISYDPSYYEIAYPNGDIPTHKGMASDVVVRSFRTIGIDLQKEVHEDMKANFGVYPNFWNATKPDPNIDHRRSQNLHRFLTRHAEDLGPSRNAADYKPGDLVVWGASNPDTHHAETHIGIVVPGPGEYSKEPWIVHNNGAGVKWENALFEYQILGHFRYPAAKP
ncbi:MAG: DUF1287 domain-containing protein [Luteolibacter sp.]